MTGPLVCGIDFSDDSRRALAWARWLAATLRQPLIIVHAVEPMLAEAANVTYGPDALTASITPELRTFVAPRDGETIHVGVGDPASVLSGTALAHGASLLVVGTQGLGRAARMWFGSTTMRLLRETSIPVLGVPPRATDVPAVAEVIVGTDFSQASAAAVQAAIDLAAACSATVTCLHVVPTVSAHSRWNDIVADAADAAVQSARRRLADAVADLPAGSLTTDVRTGDAAENLITAADGRDAVIVLGLGGADPGLRPGTTAYRVLSGADAPVLGVPLRLA